METSIKERIRLHRFRVSQLEEPSGEFICRIDRKNYTVRFISRENEMDALEQAYRHLKEHFLIRPIE